MLGVERVFWIREGEKEGKIKHLQYVKQRRLYYGICSKDKKENTNSFSLFISLVETGVC
jgi:hypothetical protein